MKPRIGVIGLGYVGLVWSAVLAAHGFHVTGVDIDYEKVDAVREGRPLLHEYMLDEMLDRALGTGRLEVTTDYMALQDADVVFITVGTPRGPDGCADLSAVYRAVEKLGDIWRNTKGYKLLVIRSTVPPGTTRRAARIVAERSGLKLGSQLGIAYNPEFLREGRAVLDVLRPYRIVIGELDRKSGDKLLEIYTELHRGMLPPVVRTTLETAELAKYASNIFLATKISFINTIALIADSTPNTDIDVIAEIMGLDPRIGREYLRAGIGFGGSCLPKDLDALICYSRSSGLSNIVPSFLEAIRLVNEYMTQYIVDVAQKLLGRLQGRKVAVLGLAFKPGTNDIRGSRSVELIKHLLEKGVVVRAHDPIVKRLPELEKEEHIELVDRVEDALQGSNAAIIATPWPEYKHIRPDMYAKLLYEPKAIIDPWRIYKDNVEELRRLGVQVWMLGVTYNG